MGKTKLRIIGPFEGNPPVTGGITWQIVSVAENIPISWRLIYIEISQNLLLCVYVQFELQTCI